MSYSNDARWITHELVSIEEYYWSDLIAFGARYLGKALDMLNAQMSRGGFLRFREIINRPLIIFMSDAESYDDYLPILNNMKKTNRWFKESLKIALVDEQYENNIEIARKLVGPKGHICI